MVMLGRAKAKEKWRHAKFLLSIEKMKKTGRD